jgi:hypothetical protein
MWASLQRYAGIIGVEIYPTAMDFRTEPKTGASLQRYAAKMVHTIRVIRVGIITMPRYNTGELQRKFPVITPHSETIDQNRSNNCSNITVISCVGRCARSEVVRCRSRTSGWYLAISESTVSSAWSCKRSSECVFGHGRCSSTR